MLCVHTPMPVHTQCTCTSTSTCTVHMHTYMYFCTHTCTLCSDHGQALWLACRCSDFFLSDLYLSLKCTVSQSRVLGVVPPSGKALPHAQRHSKVTRKAEVEKQGRTPPEPLSHLAATSWDREISLPMWLGAWPSGSAGQGWPSRHLRLGVAMADSHGAQGHHGGRVQWI